MSFVTYWCHGAPGIALSRLRAYEILGDETCKAEAATAVNTTINAIQTALDGGAGNFSLCHGLAGNAEALLYGSQLLAQELPSAESTALEVAMTGIKRYGEHDHRWPCGAGRGETPSLMLGLAGIGYFYLRLHDQTTPSILILKSEVSTQPAQSSEPLHNVSTDSRHLLITI